MNFPLYDNLINTVKNKDLLVKEKKQMTDCINEFDKEGFELIYALIKCYAENNKSTSNIPYSSTYNDNIYTFNLEKLPNKLKQLLYVFVIAHHKKIKEEKERQQMSI